MYVQWNDDLRIAAGMDDTDGRRHGESKKVLVSVIDECEHDLVTLALGTIRRTGLHDDLYGTLQEAIELYFHRLKKIGDL